MPHVDATSRFSLPWRWALSALSGSPGAARAIGAALLAIAATAPSSAPHLAPRALATPAGPGSETPGLTRSSDGRVWLSWVEGRPEGGHALRVARLDRNRWVSVRTLASGDSFMVNGADPAGVLPLAGGALAAHWRSRQAGDEHACDVRVAVASTAGDRLPEPRVAHADRSAVEHGFASLAASPDGAMLVWLDGRDFAGHDGHDAGGETQLRAATLSSRGALGAEQTIDDRACECCGTALAVTARGLLVAYRDRDTDERRDISLARYEQGRWSAPYDLHRDGWVVRGCPVNGPALDAEGSGVAAAWFTAAGDSARVLAAFSSDGGARFGEPVPVAAGEPLGRVAIARLDDGSAVVTWLEPRGSGIALVARRVDAAGGGGPAVDIARMVGSRGAGVPRVVRDADRLVFTWTEPGAVRRVRAATLPVAAFAGPPSRAPGGRGGPAGSPGR